MLNKLQYLSWLLSVFSICFAVSVKAESQQLSLGDRDNNISKITNIKEFPQTPKTIKEWLSQSPTSTPATTVIPITSVKANPTDQGVEVILETSQGDQLQVVNRSTDKALGLKPIAATTANRVGNKAPILKEKIDNIIDLGKESQPNLEKIVKLRPDLIVGYSLSPQNYQLFSQIAPTVSIEYKENGWKETLLQVGKLIDKAQEAKKTPRKISSKN